MTVRVDISDGSAWDDDEPEVRVETTDATGSTRVYRIGLTSETLSDGRLMAGSRVDDDAPAEPAGGGPSGRAWDAARRAFDSRGFDVFGTGRSE